MSDSGTKASQPASAINRVTGSSADKSHDKSVKTAPVLETMTKLLSFLKNHNGESDNLKLTPKESQDLNALMSSNQGCFQNIENFIRSIFKGPIHPAFTKLMDGMYKEQNAKFTDEDAKVFKDAFSPETKKALRSALKKGLGVKKTKAMLHKIFNFPLVQKGVHGFMDSQSSGSKGGLLGSGSPSGVQGGGLGDASPNESDFSKFSRAKAWLETQGYTEDEINGMTLKDFEDKYTTKADASPRRPAPVKPTDLNSAIVALESSTGMKDSKIVINFQVSCAKNNYQEFQGNKDTYNQAKDWLETQGYDEEQINGMTLDQFEAAYSAKAAASPTPGALIKPTDLDSAISDLGGSDTTTKVKDFETALTNKETDLSSQLNTVAKEQRYFNAEQARNAASSAYGEFGGNLDKYNQAKAWLETQGYSEEQINGMTLTEFEAAYRAKAYASPSAPFTTGNLNLAISALEKSTGMPASTTVTDFETPLNNKKNTLLQALSEATKAKSNIVQDQQNNLLAMMAEAGYNTASIHAVASFELTIETMRELIKQRTQSAKVGLLSQSIAANQMTVAAQSNEQTADCISKNATIDLWCSLGSALLVGAIGGGLAMKSANAKTALKEFDDGVENGATKIFEGTTQDEAGKAATGFDEEAVNRARRADLMKSKEKAEMFSGLFQNGIGQMLSGIASKQIEYRTQEDNINNQAVQKKTEAASTIAQEFGKTSDQTIQSSDAAISGYSGFVQGLTQIFGQNKARLTG